MLNADDPLIADLGRDAELRRREGVTFFGIEDPSQALPELQHAFDAKHCRRCGAPYALRARLRRPPRPLRVPELRRRPAAGPTSQPPRSTLLGMRGLALHRRTRPRASSAIELPLPGLYNVYNALAAIAAAGGSASTLERRSPPALAATKAVFGRVETIPVAGKRALDPADQEPGRRQRGPADAAGWRRSAERPAARPLARAQRPDRRRPRRLLDLGRRLRAARGVGRAAITCAGTRAAEIGAAAQVRGLARRADRGRRRRSTPRSTGRSPAPASGSSRCRPTRR